MYTFNLTLWLVSFLIITFYLIWIVWRYGVQASISQTYYKIKHKPLFSFVLMFTAFPLIILSSTALMFLGGSALFFVATAPAFMDDRHTKDVHLYSAYAAVLFTTLSIIIDYNMWYMTLPLVILALAIVFKVVKISNRIWWMEIIAFIQVYLTLLISKILQ